MSDIKGKITHGLYVIGTKSESSANLMTAAWLMQVSSRPYQLAVAVASHHYTANLIKKTGRFTVSILNREQDGVARACGFVSGRDHNKLEDVDAVEYHGCPVIKECAGWLYLEVEQSCETGDHTLFVGRVVDSETGLSAPVLYEGEKFFS